MGANVRNSTRSYFNLDSSIRDIGDYYEKDSHYIGTNNVCADLLSGPATKLTGLAGNQGTCIYGRH